MKKQYIAPLSERVFPETQMGFNPGGENGGIINSGSSISSEHIIVAPARQGGLKYL